MLAPIALFVYKRPTHAIQTIEALARNELAEKSHLFIFSDGPRSDADRKGVEEVRKAASHLKGFEDITLIEREQNLGLARSIISGVTDLCSKHGRVIILEDDLITSRSFLRYMNEALERYENSPQVYQISGHMFPINVSTTLDSFFLPFTTSWGWATWARAWKSFDPDMKGAPRLDQDSTLRNRFELSGSSRFYSMLKRQQAGKIDSWAIRWYLSVFLAEGLVLFPKKSLIQNIGFDGTGVHCGKASPQAPVDTDFRVGGFPEVSLDPCIVSTVLTHLRSEGTLRNRFIAFLKRIFRYTK